MIESKRNETAITRSAHEFLTSNEPEWGIKGLADITSLQRTCN